LPGISFNLFLLKKDFKIMDFLSLLQGTLLLRPYVFAFLFLFILLASFQIGWKRTLLWTVTGYGLAFAAEFSSIHWGFPFGDYFYIETTRTRELWVAGVPFMDSLSFAFLTYTGYSCAWQLVAAYKGNECLHQGNSNQKIRRSWAVLVLGAAITPLLDVIIDPVALMGDRWFLGKIYGYMHPGLYFGIPVSNFAGWALVSAAIIGVNQLLDPLFPSETPERHSTRIPYLHLGGFVLFVFVAGFNLAVTAWQKEFTLFVVSLSIVAAFLWISMRVLVRGVTPRP